MITCDAVRLGDPVIAGDRVLTPVVRVQYTLASMAGIGSVEPLGLLVDESSEKIFYPFDPELDWSRISAMLEEGNGPPPPSPGQGEAGCGTSTPGPSDLRISVRAHITKFVTIARKYISFAENQNFDGRK